MPTYSFGVTGVVVCHKKFEIEADSREDAEKELKELIDSDEYNPIGWVPETLFTDDAEHDFLKPEIVECEVDGDEEG